MKMKRFIFPSRSCIISLGQHTRSRRIAVEWRRHMKVRPHKMLILIANLNPDSNRPSVAMAETLLRVGGWLLFLQRLLDGPGQIGSAQTLLRGQDLTGVAIDQ